MSIHDTSSGFHQVAKVCSAFGCGVMAGFLYSLKQVNPELRFEFGFGSLLCAVLGALVAVVIWNRAVELSASSHSLNADDHRRQRRWFLGLMGALFGGMLASYFYAIKDVRRSALLEVLQGVTLAFLVIGGIGILLIRLARLLNQNNPPDGSTGEDESST
ncbi:MAG: hypothetical protein FJ405_14345 [Verrucomicrobia bacterium]|nr:hypothetical protein [Verrucomicrobiota bacterium]